MVGVADSPPAYLLMQSGAGSGILTRAETESPERGEGMNQTAHPPSTGGAGRRGMGPSIWAASDGKAGNEAQVMALTRALGETGRWMRIAHIHGEGRRGEPVRLHPSGWQTALPAHLWPAPKAALPPAERALFAPPWPTLWIGAGRRTAPYSAALRQWSGGATLTVHILDPKVSPARFDLLVTPEHDAITGPNVITTLGSPSYFSPDDIEEAELHFADLADERGMNVLVILGGHSKTHRMTEARVESLIAELRALALAGRRLRITCSRRTPDAARARFRAFAEDVGARFWEGPSDGRNPYLAWLLFSQAAIVTEDSANMLSDAAYFGLPVHIARLEGTSPKFDRLHEGLIRRGAAKWFTGEVGNWSYTPVREVDRVADAVVARLLERFPQPEYGTSVGTV